MRKTLYALLLPVIAVAAMAMTASAAQALPRWEICKNEGAGHKFADSECEKETGGNWEWVAPANGTLINVVTFGNLTLTAGALVVNCEVFDRGTIENKAAGGVDSVIVFENYGCKSTACPNGVTVTAKKLPWKTKLIAGPADEIEGVEVEVNCEGGIETFTGTLKPTIGSGVATFTATTGELTGAKGGKAKVEGTDHLLTTTGLLVRAK